jgi:hypothetical protein
LSDDVARPSSSARVSRPATVSRTSTTGIAAAWRSRSSMTGAASSASGRQTKVSWALPCASASPNAAKSRTQAQCTGWPAFLSVLLMISTAS